MARLILVVKALGREVVGQTKKAWSQLQLKTKAKYPQLATELAVSDLALYQMLLL
jgi:predicted NAD-dependent protein-ADP-ribosyltransferase YbiA (DUF1768 family)